MDIQFMKDYYDLRYEETDGENHFVEEIIKQAIYLQGAYDREQMLK